MKDKKNINEVNVNGSRVFIEDGKVKTAEKITLAIIEKEYSLT